MAEALTDGMTQEGLSRRFAERLASLSADGIPDTARHAARNSLIDAVGVSLAATGLEPLAAPILDYASDNGGCPEARILGRPARVPAAMAALANGALAHALDFEDTFDAAGAHPNAAVVPAALAVAEREGADGRALLDAITVGADAVCRLMLAFADDPARHGWYHPPMMSALGAGIAAARLLRLDAQGMLDTLSLTTVGFSLDAELKRSPDSALRGIRDGFAARAGVEAALLARAGIAGTEAPLEGPAGLFVHLSGAPPSEDVLFDGLGTRFLNEEVTLKSWPSCRGTHAAIALAETLRTRGIAPGDIGSVAVTTSPPDEMLMSPLAQKQAPKTAVDAKFSIPFCAAAMLTDGAVTLDSFAAGLARADLRALAGRFRDAGSFGADSRDGLTRFTVALSGGDEVILDQTRPPAPAMRDVSDATLLEKFDACVAHAHPAPRDTAALRRALLDIATLPASAIADAL